jgi:hypothetical protein
MDTTTNIVSGLMRIVLLPVRQLTFALMLDVTIGILWFTGNKDGITTGILVVAATVNNPSYDSNNGKDGKTVLSFFIIS